VPRLLIVSANFPPVNTPDMQRVRMSLPHFVDAGWEVVVLTVDDRDPLAPLEPELLQTIPAAVRIVRAHAWSRRWTRWLGLNNLGLRTLPFLFLAGRRLLRETPFDLVYFSTTQFILLPLGRAWRMEFGVPYVIDLQDPWLNDYYSQPGAPRPPGGWKYLFAHGSARLLEGWTLARAAHVISVSEAYLATLRRRYPWFGPEAGSVLTFGAPDADFALARKKFAAAPRLLPAGANLSIAYAGRLGPDMIPALDILFAALARLRDRPRRFELFFYGTSYAAAGEGVATTTALAGRHGLSDLVHEFPARIGYIDSLRIMLETDLALLLGSEDSSYSPSKLYPTLLAGKPIIAIAPARTVLAARIEELGGAALVTFDSRQGADTEAVGRLTGLLGDFAADPGRLPAPPAKLDLVARQYTAAAVAVGQLEIFNAIIRRHHPAKAAFLISDQWPGSPEAPVE
jgi:glycosyltransferase involved in cell wall biosynthesis